MLLTITLTNPPDGDLGYWVGKHPVRVQSFPLNFGRAHVDYPEVSDERCTAALLFDIDPVGLVRRPSGSFPLAQYVNDRPYVASSFLCVAIGQVLGSALPVSATSVPNRRRRRSRWKRSSRPCAAGPAMRCCDGASERWATRWKSKTRRAMPPFHPGA